MNKIEELLSKCPAPSGPLFGSKSRGLFERRQEAKKISQLMRERPNFCFLRVGDMELRLLLSRQFNCSECLREDYFSDGPSSGTFAIGNPGLSGKHLHRLWAAYEGADYVDFHEGNWPNESLVPHLKLNRAPETYSNPNKESSLVFLTWLENEFQNYCAGRRVGFVGAEARILEKLVLKDEFHKWANNYWPVDARENGRNLDKNLDLIKEDIREFITANKLDTVFLSLGGGAKIIGYELSRELNVRFFDFGSLTRALTYSGCDGNRFSRSPHYPFLYRLPFGLYMDCLERAMPTLTAEELLAKAHGQLIQEIIKKEVGWSHASMEYECSSENMAAFRESFRTYLKRYKFFFNKSAASKRERAGFLHFCGTHKLTFEGQAFMLQFNAKKTLRELLNSYL
jgi:hypothetical protein